jgi:enoyl-CoA hydratase/carnithine racemase
MTDLILVDITDGVATVTLNRPDAMNAAFKGPARAAGRSDDGA